MIRELDARFSLVPVLTGITVFFGCGDNGVGPGDAPAFSELTGLDTLPYVAYQTPDEYTKLDTVTFSFKYNSAKIASILVEATLDSGVTWITIATPAPTKLNGASVQWVPKDGDSATKNFFGYKTGKIKVSAPGSAESLESASFILVGAMPLDLVKPLGGERFGMSDTVMVEFGANMDLLSRIQTFFKTDAMNNWWEFLDSELLPSPKPPIMNYRHWFIPSQLDASVIADAGNFAQPIKILLQDYSNDLAVQTTGYITITP